MPAPADLSAVLEAARSERGTGIFVGPRFCIDELCRQERGVHLTFDFDGPVGTPWRGTLLSFAYQGKLKAKKKDRAFSILPISTMQVPLRVGVLPFCPARVSTFQHTPSASDDTARAGVPLPAMPGIAKPKQAPVWNETVMTTLASMFPHKDVSRLFALAASPSGAPSSFAGDRT